MAYAERDDVYAELSEQAFVMAPRPVGSPPSSLTLDFDRTTGIIRLPGAGLTADDVVMLLATGGGSLPGGASSLTAYYPLPGAASGLYRLAATPSGTPLTFSSQGLGWSVLIDHGRRIDKHLADTAAIIDEHLTAHSTPLKRDPTTGRYPQVIVGLNARMTARKASISLQVNVASYRVAVDRLFAIEKQDLILLADWKSGKPVYPEPTDQNDTPDDAALATNSGVTMAWVTGAL